MNSKDKGNVRRKQLTHNKVCESVHFTHHDVSKATYFVSLWRMGEPNFRIHKL